MAYQCQDNYFDKMHFCMLDKFLFEINIYMHKNCKLKATQRYRVVTMIF